MKNISLMEFNKRVFLCIKLTDFPFSFPDENFSYTAHFFKFLKEFSCIHIDLIYCILDVYFNWCKWTSHVLWFVSLYFPSILHCDNYIIFNIGIFNLTLSFICYTKHIGDKALNTIHIFGSVIFTLHKNTEVDLEIFLGYI